MSGPVTNRILGVFKRQLIRIRKLTCWSFGHVQVYYGDVALKPTADTNPQTNVCWSIATAHPYMCTGRSGLHAFDDAVYDRQVYVSTSNI